MKIEFPVLKTDRLILREFMIHDAADVFGIFSSKEVTEFHNQETMTDTGEAKRLVSIRSGIFQNNAGVRWAIVLKENPKKVIGSVGYFNLNRSNGFSEIGYDLHQDFWRKGIMKEALKETINFGFSERFFFYQNRIEALTFPQNKASIELLLKLGFKQEGLRREYGFFKGKYNDLQCFSLLRREWAVLSA